MNGLKIMCMKVERLGYLGSVSLLLFALRRLPEAFDVTATKSYYPHYFNTEENLNYVGPIPDISFYGAEEMREEEREIFSSGTSARNPCRLMTSTCWEPTLKMTFRS